MTAETMETLYQVANLIPMPFWLLIALAPASIWSQRLVYSGLVPAAMGVAYVILFVTAPSIEGVDATSLGGLTQLMAIPHIAFLGWVHYLAFDLMVGAFVAKDAITRGIPKWQVAPCLFFTLMAGPAGLLMYVVLRGVTRGRDALLGEEAA